MKNTIITLASVATLAGATSAQTILESDDFPGLLSAYTTSTNPTTSSMATFVDNGTTVNGTLSFNSSLDNGLEFHNSTKLIGIGDHTSSAGIADTEMGHKDQIFLTFDQDVYFSSFHIGAFTEANSGLTVTAGGSTFQVGPAYGSVMAPAGNLTTNFSPVYVAAGSAITFSAEGNNESIGIIGRFTVSTIPEPSSTALLGLGALGLLTRRRRS